MSANECINAFSSHLFWDIRKEDIDLEQYPGLPKIVEEAKKMRELEPRALAYVAAISNTPKEKFRCYTYQQSIPQHWNF